MKLGLSRGKKGRGFGQQFRQIIIKDMKDIIDLGADDPEVFHLMGLFEDNVGPDRLSDMNLLVLFVPQDILHEIPIAEEWEV